jgi:small-conductance mechanosensitive channel
MDSAQSLLITLESWLHWLPNPVVAIIIVALAVVVAYALHRSVRKALRHLLADRYPYVFSVFVRMRGVTRLGLVIVALTVAIPVAPFDPATAQWLSRLLLIAVIALVGWAALTALRIAADLYLRQFRIDIGDNLLARKHLTQVRVLMRTIDALVVIVTIGAALMTFEPVRQYGVSLFASAGVAGIVAGLAARPVLSNLFAGVQLAMTQPIRIDDAVIVENEWGSIEEITSTYVVVRLWDWRRMIVPLTYFIEKPFQNWTRETSALMGSAFLYLDYRAPVGHIRDKLKEIVGQSKNWDGNIVGLQVTDAKEHTIELRCLMSAPSAPQAFDLRCEVREKLIDFLNKEHPEALPRRRQVTIDERTEEDAPSARENGHRKSAKKSAARAG